MPSDILTPEILLRESLQILHQKMIFGKMIHRNYEKEFKGSGAKIGEEIRIRRPPTYHIRRGRIAQPQGTKETFETLKIDRQVGVDMTFTSKELTLDLDAFRKRILEPAITLLTSDLEYQLLSMAKDVPMVYPDDVEASDDIYANGLIYDWVDRCGRELDIFLSPKKNRYALLNSFDESLLINNLKELVGDSEQLSKQFVEGKMKRFQGFSHKSSPHMPFYKTGVSAHKTNLVEKKPTQIHWQPSGGTPGIIDGQTYFPVLALSNNDWHRGDIVTVSGLSRVHPETKRVYRECNPTFVITQDSVTGEAMQVWPPIHFNEGKYQNIKLSTGNQVPSELAIYALDDGNIAQRQNLYFHKDAFTMATVDLKMPKDVDFKAQENHEGISMRIVRKYDIKQDEFPCRIDILFGFKTLRPELARRIIGGKVNAPS